MNPVTIVTIKNKIPLYKKDELANSIELIELEETGFELVAQKGLYEIGDKAVLVQPDYNVSDISLFESYIRPNGDESKSLLGKVEGKPRRIRAKKFTLSKEPNGDYVYSNGILLPTEEVFNYLDQANQVSNATFESQLENLTLWLGITKYEEPEVVSKGGIKNGITAGKFPEGVYKTDEENINNLWNHIEKKLSYPIALTGSEKIDGSSITIGVSPNIPEGFICSRNLRKRITAQKTIGKRKKTLLEHLLFWKKVDLNIYEEVLNDDDFVKHGKKYLDILKTLSEDKYTPHYYILRGELNGGTLKGSGNKNNPASKQSANIKFFGLDYVDSKGNVLRADNTTFNSFCTLYSLPRVKEVFNKSFNSKEELLTECNNYFKTNMIEGIVVRTLESNFSAKVMNLEYDSKK